MGIHTTRVRIIRIAYFFSLSNMEQKESFAEKLMRKQGWTDGQGLGRQEQGIVDPIKATLKFDTTGIGHDIAKEFTNNWWDLAYKKAANKIEVEKRRMVR